MILGYHTTVTTNIRPFLGFLLMFHELAVALCTIQEQILLQWDLLCSKGTARLV